MSASYFGTNGIIFHEGRQVALIKNFTVKVGRDGVIRIHIPVIENYSLDLLPCAFQTPLPSLLIHATINGQRTRITEAKIDRLTVSAKRNEVVLIKNVRMLAVSIHWMY
jgi:hypothetical protein